MVSISELNTSGLSHRCSEEQRLFLSRQPHDPRYCYELFLRALQNRDEIAWKHLIEIFSPLVKSWVHKHGGFPNCGVDMEEVVHGTFVRFFAARAGRRVDPTKSLNAILDYLSRCMNSEIVDHIRQNRLPTLQLTDDMPGAGPVESDPIANEKLWSIIRSSLKDENERIVAHATFVLSYGPSQIYEKYPARFKSVQEVHRTKENIVARLRRCEELKEYFGFDV